MCKNILSQGKYYRHCAISIKHTQRIAVCRVFYMEFNFARKFDIKKCYLHDLTDQQDASWKNNPNFDMDSWAHVELHSIFPSM